MNYIQKKLLVPVWLLGVCYTIAFTDGFFAIGWSDDLYMFMGFAILVAIVWLFRVTYKKYEDI